MSGARTALTLHPLVPFGAEVDGIDLAQPLDDDTFESISQAVCDHSFLVFHDQRLDPSQLVRFSSRFGHLQGQLPGASPDGNSPEVLLVSDTASAGRPVYDELAARSWHSDLSTHKPSGFITALYGVEVPSSGGATEIADMVAAYEALPEAIRTMLEGKLAVHDLRYKLEQFAEHLSDEQARQNPPVEHPVVSTHPVTGRKALYIGIAQISHITGIPVEGRALIHALVAFATQERFVYRHVWKAGDLLVWNNHCTMHRGRPYPAGEKRVLWLTTSTAA